jgi:hypothetical protein
MHGRCSAYVSPCPSSVYALGEPSRAHSTATVSATVSPGKTGHFGAGKRAPMLGKRPFPGKLTGTAAPAVPTLARRHWIVGRLMRKSLGNHEYTTRICLETSWARAHLIDSGFGSGACRVRGVRYGVRWVRQGPGIWTEGSGQITQAAEGNEIRPIFDIEAPPRDSLRAGLLIPFQLRNSHILR